MALDQQNNDEETVVHHWANLEKTKSEEDSLNVVKLLVDKGANITIRDKYGYTPIVTAAASYNWSVVDFLMEKGGLGRTEKIDGMEMAAATILNDSPADFLLEQARGYFHRALLLRNEEPNPILKTPLTLQSGRTIEWTTIAEVEAAIHNPTEHKIQSYLTRLRICPGRSSIAGSLMRDSLSDCFSDLMEQRRFDDIRDLLCATLDRSLSFVSLPNSERSVVIIEVVKHLLSMMSQLEIDHHLFIADTFKKPLKFIVATKLPFHRHRCEDILLQFVAFLARNAKILIDEEMKESFCKLLAQERRKSRATYGLKTLLHMACLNPEDLSTIRLLLLSEANPNAGDDYGNAPLHILATQYRRLSGIDDEVVGSAARLLLKYGAHLCKVNLMGYTAAHIWRGENYNLKDLPDWLREEKVKKLSCQCARVITSQNISLKGSKLSATLLNFVDAHRS